MSPDASPQTGRGRSRGTLVRALSSWRTASVSLLMFPSGVPLGLIWYALPVWLTKAGIDIQTVGLMTLVQAPWTFKFLWSPLLDRFAPPWLGRKRGWILLAQVGLLLLIAGLALVDDPVGWLWLVGLLALAVAFVSATQDIALDAYTVEVLHPEEQGVASGARTAIYRVAMFLAGALAISLAGYTSWGLVFLILSFTFLPSLGLTLGAPEPERLPMPPATFRQAVWGPLVDLMRKHRALEIGAFVILYKMGDNLATALIRPFLVQVGYSDLDVGVVTMTIGLAGTAGGALVGGVLTTAMGLGPALWIFGILQIVSNLGYVAVAEVGIHQPLLYAAMALESVTQGMGTAAFMALLLRLTAKRFSATQYAILSSLFALGRVVAGPLAGFTAAAIGWRDFFILTMVAGLPGLALLWRFIPLGVREPTFEVEGKPASPAAGRETGSRPD